MPGFEDEYLDVLQNLEFAIVSVYRQDSELLDFDVERALNSLIRVYQAEQRGRTVPEIALQPLAQEVYEYVRTMCEWRLGREDMPATNSDKTLPSVSPLSLEEIIHCLKRIRKSVQRWNKEGGRQGYLQFISDYVH